MIDHQSETESGRILDKSTIKTLYGKRGMLRRFNMTHFKNLDRKWTDLSVCLNQQLHLVNSVA